MSIRPLVSLLASLLLVSSLSVTTLARKASMDQSVRPLKYNGQTFCTTWSINEKQGYWATAAHCPLFIAHDRLDPSLVSIGNGWAYVVAISNNEDVAVYQASVHAPALLLAQYSAEVGDKIEVVGHPYGLFRLITTQGYMAGRMEPADHGNYIQVSDVLDVTVAGGSSGSPVMKTDGYVTGLLWGKFTDSDHALSVPLDALRRVLAGFLQPG